MKNCIMLLAMSVAVFSGCKVVVEVPTGGAVATESGSFECSEEQICEVDIDDASFEETFVASAGEDYEFRGWRERSGGLCSSPAERLEGCTVSTLAYAGIPQIISFLEADIPVYLEPEFAAKPTTTVQFPIGTSSAVNQIITARGTASDPDGIVRISVNGTDANIMAVETADNGLPVEATWQAEIVLEDITTDISVVVTDSSGSMNANSDAPSVEFIRVPTRFSLDDVNNRLIGRVRGDNFTNDVVDYDLETGTSSVVFEELRSDLPHCYKSDTGEYLYVVRSSGNRVAIYSIDVAARTESIVASTVLDVVSEGFENALFMSNLACASDINSVYLTYSLSESGKGITTSRITGFDLNTGNAELVAQFSRNDGDPAILGGAKLYGDRLIAWPSIGFDAPMEFVNTDTGRRTELSKAFNLRISNLATDEPSNTIYAVNLDGIYEVPGNTRFDSELSLDEDYEDLDIAQPRSFAIDAETQKAYLGDSSLDLIMEIDLANGERRELLARGRGEGTRLVFPSALHVNSESNTAYLLDDGDNAQERLFEVDLSTGDRRIIGDITGQFNQSTNGLAVDAERDIIYVGLFDTVLAIEPERELVYPVAGLNTGVGPELESISDIEIDKANERLLIADDAANAVYAMDLRRQTRTLISRAGTQGSGIPLDGIDSIALDSDNSTLYVASRDNGNIIAVDLESGNRRIALDSCLDDAGENQLGRFRSLRYIGYVDEQLVIVDFGLKTMDVNTGECTILESTPLGLGISDLSPVPGVAGVFYATVAGGMGLFDLQSRGFVFLSD